MTQQHRWALANAVWGLAWTGVLVGVLFDDQRWLAGGLFAASGGVVVMVWIIAEHVVTTVERRLAVDLGDRDRRRTIEMAEALVRADQDGIRLVD